MRKWSLIQPTLVICTLVITYTTTSQAAPLTPAPTRDALFYYEIGGADAISRPASQLSTASVGSSIDLGLGYSCGNFNPILGIGNQLNQVIDRLQTLAVNGLNAAVAALPMYILQRANPGLYDLLQNLLIKAETSIDLANQSCETMERSIAQGRNPYYEWLEAAKGIQWRVQMGRQGWASATVDAKTAKDNVEKASGQDGLPWIGGQHAGGMGQPPIQVIGDVAAAGYNLLLNREVATTTAPVGITAEQRIVELWPTPAELRTWVNDVLGEVAIRTTDDPSNGKAGSGLFKRVGETQKILGDKLTTLVAGGPAAWTLAPLNEVSAPGTAVTRSVIESLKALAPQERTIVTTKLAGEIALAKTIEEALQARRALLAGRQEPNVAGSPAGKEQGILDRTVAELNREIDDLLFEVRVRKEVVSDTISAVLRLDAHHRSAVGATPVPVSDPLPVNHGAVKP